MVNRIGTILSICRKDLIGLAPFIILAVSLIVMETLITKLDMDIEGQIWYLIVSSAPYVSSSAIGVLIIAVFQSDSPSSLTNDWLIRPISERDLFLAKLALLLIVVALPLVLVRFVVNVFTGYPFLESILEASTFKTSTAMIGIPAFIIIGIVSRSILQALGIIGGLLLFIGSLAVLPAVSVPNPGKMNYRGFEWVYMSLIFAAVLVCLWQVARFQYLYRDGFKARMSIAITLALGAIGLVASFQAPLWPYAYAALSTLVDDIDKELAGNITLDSIYGCYPAVKVGNDLYGDAEAPQEGIKGLAGLNYFTAWELESAGPEGIAFSTRVQARNLPDSWRLATVNAIATFSNEYPDESFSFAPAGGATPARVNSRSDGTHFWALPEDQVEKFAVDGFTELTIDLDVAVLEPKQYSLEPDSRRRHFQGIGYCSAEIDARRNEIVVECFKRGPRPVLVSAELEGIPSSRVDAGMPNFSPDFLQFFGGSHYRMHIDSPSLLQDPKVVLTVFQQKAFLSKQLRTPGILGDSLEVCPLPSDDLQNDALLASWSDNSAHQASFFTVDRNVRLEVLDWPYTGEIRALNDEVQTLVLLAGGGSTAHSYDDIAPQLAQDFRVVAITRRGFGDSSKPTRGYDLPRLTMDIVQVIDALAIDKAIFVGHSLAGDELSALGANHPQRVAGLVYLDAAIDRTGLIANNGASLNGIAPPMPRPVAKELQSYEAMQGYFTRIGSVVPPEGSIMSTYDFVSGARDADPRLGQAIVAQLPAPRYEKIVAPTKSIYAIPQITSAIRPWYDPNDELLQKNALKVFEQREEFLAKQISEFRDAIPSAEVILIEGGDHAIHISHPDEVIATIHRLAESISE